MRDLVSNYYLGNNDTERRGEALKGEYGFLTFDLVPRGASGAINTSIDSMSDEMAKSVVSSVLESELRRLIIPQRNRIEFLEFLYSTQMEEATALLAEIEA